MKVGIINYSLGNVGSVYSAFRFYTSDVKLISSVEEMHGIDVFVLAGVGHFKTAVSRLKELRFWNALNEEVIEKKKPILGICLGMQLFADTSSEDESSKGFGWIKGNVVKISGASLRVPHIGWNEVTPLEDAIFSGVRSKSFYFMHSYHFLPEDKSVVTGITRYGGLQMVSSVRKDNIFGVQFHPEKSQADGLRFIRNFLEVVS